MALMSRTYRFRVMLEECARDAIQRLADEVGWVVISDDHTDRLSRLLTSTADVLVVIPRDAEAVLRCWRPTVRPISRGEVSRREYIALIARDAGVDLRFWQRVE